MRGAATATESKLQHLHPRHPELLAQGFNILGDDTEILGNYRQIPQFPLQQAHQLLTRRWPPLATASVGSASRHSPVRRQRAKVIDTQNIHALELLNDPIPPKREAVILNRLPVIKRVAPQLAVGRKVVG